MEFDIYPMRGILRSVKNLLSKGNLKLCAVVWIFAVKYILVVLCFCTYLSGRVSICPNIRT